jgi:hypothetical protein
MGAGWHDPTAAVVRWPTSRNPAHPPHPADVAQGRRFASILRIEHADLRAQLAALEACGPQSGSGGQTGRLRTQIAEVRDLLAALERRFSSTGPPTRGAA